MDSDSSAGNQKHQADVDNFEPVLFKKRWLMLILFSSVSMLNAFQWLHINIVLPSAIFFWNSSLPSKWPRTYCDECALDYVFISATKFSLFHLIDISTHFNPDNA